jgi:hypothetical protein
VCDGTSSLCPVDDAVGNGASCTLAPYGAGSCFGGKCTSFRRQCAEIGNVFPGGPWYPCSQQTAMNSKAGLGYCGELYCVDTPTTSGSGPIQCSFFDISAGPERMANGTACGEPNETGELSSRMVCYNSECVAAENTNQRYRWATTEWEKCNDCNTQQGRNVSCVRTWNGQTAADLYCTQAAKPPSIQPCSDDELLCEHTIGGTISFAVLGHEIEISTAVVIGASIGIFFFLIVMLQVCTSCIVHRTTDKKLKVITAVPIGAVGSPASPSKQFAQI